MLRKLLAAGGLIAAAMCLTAPASYADVVVTAPVTVDQVLHSDMLVAAKAITHVDELAVSYTAMPGSGDDGEDEPIAACTGGAVYVGDPLRPNDLRWCAPAKPFTETGGSAPLT